MHSDFKSILKSWLRIWFNECGGMQCLWICKWCMICELSGDLMVMMVMSNLFFYIIVLLNCSVQKQTIENCKLVHTSWYWTATSNCSNIPFAHIPKSSSNPLCKIQTKRILGYAQMVYWKLKLFYFASLFWLLVCFFIWVYYFSNLIKSTGGIYSLLGLLKIALLKKCCIDSMTNGSELVMMSTLCLIPSLMEVSYCTSRSDMIILCASSLPHILPCHNLNTCLTFFKVQTSKAT